MLLTFNSLLEPKVVRLNFTTSYLTLEKTNNQTYSSFRNKAETPPSKSTELHQTKLDYALVNFNLKLRSASNYTRQLVPSSSKRSPANLQIRKHIPHWLFELSELCWHSCAWHVGFKLWSWAIIWRYLFPIKFTS